MKKVIITFLLILVGAASISPAFAEDLMTAKTMDKNMDHALSGRGATESGTSDPSTRSLEAVKKRALSAIDKRIDMLKNQLSRIDSNSKFDETSKTELKKQIEAVIAKLTALKSEVTAAKDVPSIQVVFKRVLDEKIYTVVAQKMQLLYLITKLTSHVTRLQDIAKKLDTLMATTEKNGKDVTTLKADIAALNTQITALHVTLIQAKTKVMNANTTDSKVVVADVRADLLKAKTQLLEIKNLITTIRIELRNLNNHEITITPTITNLPTSMPMSSETKQ